MFGTLAHFLKFIERNSIVSLVFCFIQKTYIDQSPKPQVGSNWLKSPPPPQGKLQHWLVHVT